MTVAQSVQEMLAGARILKDMAPFALTHVGGVFGSGALTRHQAATNQARGIQAETAHRYAMRQQLSTSSDPGASQQPPILSRQAE